MRRAQKTGISTTGILVKIKKRMVFETMFEDL
jgi:hypothetical protein